MKLWKKYIDSDSDNNIDDDDNYKYKLTDKPKPAKKLAIVTARPEFLKNPKTKRNLELDGFNKNIIFASINFSDHSSAYILFETKR